MAISIDWATKIINVPQTYLTPTANPASFNLDTDVFRLDLKAIEAGVPGMPNERTHNHNTEVPLGGIIYARVIEIINGYTVTFEDGQYAVNLFGSNNNIGDVTNLNQVSVRTNNSAGLIVDPGISESLDYGEHVIYDEDNTLGVGTSWPIGTYANPVNNVPDLQSLLTTYNRSEVLCLSNITLTQDFDDMAFVSKTGDENFFPNGFKAHDCSISKMILTGDFNHSKIFADQCSFNDIQNAGGTIFNSIFFGDILQTPNYQLILQKCSSTKPGIEPVYIDMVQGVDSIFGTRGHSGPLLIGNCDTSASTATIIFEAGSATLSGTCTNGLIVMGGICDLTDDTTSGCTVDITGVIDPDTSNTLAYNNRIYIQSGSTNTGVDFPSGTHAVPLNNIADALTIATERGLDRLHFLGDWYFPNGTVLQDYTFMGEGFQESTFSFEAGSIVLRCNVEDATITGKETGLVGFKNCLIDDLGSVGLAPSSIDISIDRCFIRGVTTIPSNYSGTISVVDSWATPDSNGNPPTVNMGTADMDLQVRNLSGFLNISGCTQPTSDVRVFLNSGGIILDSSVTAGDFLFTGVGNLINNSTSVSKLDSKGLISGKVIEDTYIAVESLRPHHTGFGKMIYWDPLLGDDTHDGTEPSLAVTTFAQAHNLAGDGEHDTIIALASDTGQIVVDEHITISKNYTFLRGPGRDFLIKPTTSTGHTITIDALGSEISGMVVETSTGGTYNAIQVDTGADFFLIENMWSHVATDMAVHVMGDVVYGRINGCFFSDTGGHGIHLNGNVRHTKITDTEISNCGNDGIVIEGTTARNNIIGDGVKVYGGSAYGIRITSPATRNFISFDASIYDNASGRILDNSINTIYGKENIADAVWDVILSGHTTSGSTGEALASGGGGSFTGNTQEIALAVWNTLTSSGNTDGSFGVLLSDLIFKAETQQHSINVQTEMLKNKPNNP
tara:strand:+ start:22653 stop:25514 length:2862 start_codon:yes stop_codon:yes gene_type:complete